MAEAHNAAAFSIILTSDSDYQIAVDTEVLERWGSKLKRFIRKSFIRIKNDLWTLVYPFGVKSFLATLVLLAIYDVEDYNLSFSWKSISNYVLLRLPFTAVVWGSFVYGSRMFIKAISSWSDWNTAWMYERHTGKFSKKSLLYLKFLRVVRPKVPATFAFQSLLPNQPVPGLNETVSKLLESIRPVKTIEEYIRMEELAEEFKKTIGPRCQRKLLQKSAWAFLTNGNYVTDWWEEFVYLRSREPVMINSNYYCMETLRYSPTNNQAARAANLTHAAFLFRKKLERHELTPIYVPRAGIPFCSNQYERMFNTTRIPQLEKDTLFHRNDSQHVAVYCNRRWFRLNCYENDALLAPADFQRGFQQILDSPAQPLPGEELLGVMTASNRDTWAQFRTQEFRSLINHTSLKAIESAAFVLILDDEEGKFSEDDPEQIDHWARIMLHGKAHNRWFDKSFNMVVCQNAKAGLNAEHAWYGHIERPKQSNTTQVNGCKIPFTLRADALVVAHFWEFCVATDRILGYKEDGNCQGERTGYGASPEHLRWEFSADALKQLEAAEALAQQKIATVDHKLLVFEDYGKGFVKQVKMSPDSYLQMALQLAYYRDQGKFSLTYESSTTRLFRDGRTETVRSVTEESCEFVHSMCDDYDDFGSWQIANNENGDESQQDQGLGSGTGSETGTANGTVKLGSSRRKKRVSFNIDPEQRSTFLRKACDVHQRHCADAMAGRGIDRHLFALYLTARGAFGVDPPFLKEVLSDKWRLSTSQTPQEQSGLLDLRKNPEFVSAGGGFGPVAWDGYGVSYIMSGENMFTFHISSDKTCPTTDSSKFRLQIQTALREMKDMLDEAAAIEEALHQ